MLQNFEWTLGLRLFSLTALLLFATQPTWAKHTKRESLARLARSHRCHCFFGDPPRCGKQSFTRSHNQTCSWSLKLTKNGACCPFCMGGGVPFQRLGGRHVWRSAHSRSGTKRVRAPRPFFFFPGRGSRSRRRPAGARRRNASAPRAEAAPGTGSLKSTRIAVVPIMGFSREGVRGGWCHLSSPSTAKGLPKPPGQIAIHKPEIMIPI